MAEDVLVHEFHKSADEMVRATIGEFRGRKTVGIRIFYEDVDGDWKPTKKGITLSAELFPELKKAVEMIEAGLQQEEQKDPSADGE
ncbi:MAG TPA: transcriptional coactivator p15/PC4 family protein [bacterium]|nr:transcriptional coactivator p15/PC4 family protein [bacterium]HQP98299.1 transcriptional coactivator p15/PC4 family protein [bacterium]